MTKKPSKIVKFTKIDQTFRNTYLTWPKRSRIKLVVSSNLLRQENVCLIPRESEHPSNINNDNNNDNDNDNNNNNNNNDDDDDKDDNDEQTIADSVAKEQTIKPF